MQKSLSIMEVEEEEENEEDTNEVRGICSLADAKGHLQEAHQFLESSQFTTDIDFSCVSKIESTLLRNMPYRQSSIRDFFQ